MAVLRGGIAQLGERDAGSVEARGSSPLTSTSESSAGNREENDGSRSKVRGARFVLMTRFRMELW